MSASGKTKVVAKRVKAKAKTEPKPKAKAKPPTRTGRTAKNEALLGDKDVTLTGDERALIMRAIEKVPSGQRHNTEIRLLSKVR